MTEAIQNNITTGVLPDGRMYYNIAQKVLGPLLHDNYAKVSEVCKYVQSELNKSAGIGLKPVVPPMNMDRANGLIDKISSDTYDKTQWVVDDPIVNFSQNIVDESIKANAKQHAKVGLHPTIVREAEGGCCEWCSKLDGTYDYPAPKQVYQRHQRCRCTVDYKPDKRSKRRQDVHSKEWIEEDKSVTRAPVKYRRKQTEEQKLLKLPNKIGREIGIKVTRGDIESYLDYRKALGHQTPGMKDFLLAKAEGGEKWINLKRDYSVLKAIDMNPKIPAEKIAHAKTLYYKFKQDRMYTSDHFIEQFMNRQQVGKKKLFDYDQIVEMCRNQPNYYDPVSNRDVLISDKLSIVKGREKEDWKYITLRYGRTSKRWIKND